MPVSARTTPVSSQELAVTATDKALDEQIERHLKSDVSLEKYDIDLSVDAGVATLTGTVATAREKTRATRLAYVTGITRVENRIVVERSAATKGTADKVADKVKEGTETAVDKTKEGLSKAGEAITDGWITTRVHSRFVGEDLLKGSEISVDTDNHVVTLKGTVTNRAGRTRAGNLAMRTEGVHRVVNQLTIGPKV